MEINVLNIKGQETGRKVTLNDAIFGIEPNDHVIYLDRPRDLSGCKAVHGQSAPGYVEG